MTPQSSKAKGRRLQQWVRDHILSLWLNVLQPDDVRSTGMGQGGEDIQLSPLARTKVPYNIECKNKAKSQIHTFYDQAKEHGGHEPLVIVKMDRKDTLAIVKAEHFFSLLKELDEIRDRK